MSDTVRRDLMRPKDSAMSAEEYRAWRRKWEEDLLESSRALREKLDRVRSLVSDWHANSGSRELGEQPEARTWSKAALQLAEAIDDGPHSDVEGDNA